jgi:murein DD-endopeptidase MepM/ murein hydrolase activator NlpD
VVIASEYHYQFGNMLEIDHGNNIITRYAHASRLFVKVGDIVKRGQHVADVGSTGRSTGAHLHFEVRIAASPRIRASSWRWAPMAATSPSRCRCSSPVAEPWPPAGRAGLNISSRAPSIETLQTCPI